MFSMLLVVLCIAFRATVVAQSSPSIVCVAGQCLQGFSNTVIGAKLSAQGDSLSVRLLPGQYTSTTNPQLLHNLLNSRSSTLVGSAGFQSATLSTLPLDLQLEPGLATYSQSLYSGQAAFAKLPDVRLGNTSTPLDTSSIAISSNVWIAISSNNRRIILWESVPDTSQLPSPGAMSILDVQSSACPSPCSGLGVCSASGTCTCPTGFTGSSCESCQQGFFGPNCEPCPPGCSDCDQGISGSGCLTPNNTATGTPPSPSPKCDCLNGVCGANGQCACNIGWTTANNGTACAKCASGFSLSNGDCQVCGLGCARCADGSGVCITCRTGFTQDANDPTKCIPTPTPIVDPPCSTGFACQSRVPCPTGSYDSGGRCSPCSPSCSTCSGPTSNDCTLCASGSYFFNGNCVPADSDGVCQGTNGMVANNYKVTCDSCGSKCTSCTIPNFNSASTIDQAKCTGCLPGFTLTEGKCIAGCPAGMIVSSQDNITCITCSPSCGSCGGSADLCLTCPTGQLLFSGRCVSSCPSDTFSSSGSCRKCHPDCSTCSGADFNQCNSCSTSRPVLVNGRCLSTCSKSQYFDTRSSTCESCDSSCSSCAGPGPQNCLACSSATRVLRAGSCVAANCQNSNSVIPGLGVCLSELVQVPRPSGTGSASSLPTITGLTDPTVATSHLRLTWWQILLMSLGCAFIFIVLLWCWRRRVRKQREKRTKTFAREKNLDGRGWRAKLFRFGERLFGLRREDGPSGLPMSYRDSLHSSKIPPIEHDIILRNLAPKRSERKEKRDSMDDLLSAYEYSIDSRERPVSSVFEDEKPRRLKSRVNRDSHSLYTAATGKQRSTPDPRESLQRDPVVSNSIGSSAFMPALTRKPPPNWEDVAVDLNNNTNQAAPDVQMPSVGNRFNLTDAQAYMMAIKPTPTGQSQSTPSPFPIPTYAAASSFSPPMGADSSGPVRRVNTGGENLLPMPVSLTGNGQTAYSLPAGQTQYQVPQAPYMMPSGANVMSQPMQTGASYSTVSPHNPFRYRGP